MQQEFQAYRFESTRIMQQLLKSQQVQNSKRPENDISAILDQTAKDLAAQCESAVRTGLKDLKQNAKSLTDVADAELKIKLQEAQRIADEIRTMKETVKKDLAKAKIDEEDDGYTDENFPYIIRWNADARPQTTGCYGAGGSTAHLPRATVSAIGNGQRGQAARPVLPVGGNALEWT